MFVLSFVSFSVFAVTDKKRVFDDANLLSSSDVSLIQEELKRISDEQKAEFFIVTRQSLENQSIEQLARSFFKEQAGDNSSGAVLAISMSERDLNYTAFGFIYELNINKITRIRERISEKMTSKNYYEAFMLFAKLSTAFGFWDNFKEFMSLGFIASTIITFITIFILIFVHKGINTVNSNTYALLGSFKLTNTIDRYLRTTTTKTKISSSSNKGSNGGSGSGSRSGSSSGKF